MDNFGSVVSNNINNISGCIIGAGAVAVRGITEIETYLKVSGKEDRLRKNNGK